VLKPRIGLYGVLEKSEECWQDADSLLSLVQEQLEQAGMEVHRAPELVYDNRTAIGVAESWRAEELDLLLALVVCWSFDNLSLSILRRVPRPLAILAVPGIRSGSLVGAHQLGSLLTDLGLEHAVFQGDPASAATYQPLCAYARAAAAQQRLSLGKIGNVGRRTPGMTPAAFDEVEVTRLLGPQVVTYGWEEIEESARSVAASVVEEQTHAIISLAGEVRSSGEGLADSARLFLALRERAQREGLLALSLGCYPHYAGRVCLACALLGEEGVPTSCEGDLNSALAMLLLYWSTGQPVHFGEILEVNQEENSIVTSHCGCAPPSLAAERSQVEVCPVRLWERGACLRFRAKGGPATFANLVGRRGTYRLCVVEGEALVTEMVFEGNPVKLRPRIPVREFIEVIGEKGFGHHWMMGYGQVASELRAFCKLAGLQAVFL